MPVLAEKHLSKHYYGIDAARFIAALAVWAFHRNHATYGYLGVPVFFAISGFVISNSRTGRTVPDFLAARTARLYPGFVLCLVLTLAVTPASWAHIAANLTMAPRLFGVDPIDGVYWSLLFEMLFYGYAAVLGVSRPALWIWLALSAVHMWHPLPGKVLLVLEWAPYFVVGCAVYLRSWPLWLAATVLSVVNAALQTKASPEAAGLIVGVTCIAFPAICQLRGNIAWLGYLATLSYPIYLLHNEFGRVTIIPAVIIGAMAVAYVEPFGKRAILSFYKQLKPFSLSIKNRMPALFASAVHLDD